jgi:hypothetical protein
LPGGFELLDQAETESIESIGKVTRIGRPDWESVKADHQRKNRVAKATHKVDLTIGRRSAFKLPKVQTPVSRFWRGSNSSIVLVVVRAFQR